MGSTTNTVWLPIGIVTLLESIVTEAFRASALPFSLAPVASVTVVHAIMVPLKSAVVPSVAALPTCQKILSAVAPPLRTTMAPVFTVSPVPIWKM